MKKSGTSQENSATLTDAAVRLWPTPRASMNENRTTKDAPSHGTTHGRTLAGTASLWPTPRASDGTRGSDPPHGDGAQSLKTTVTHRSPGTEPDGSDGSTRVDLNPAFVAALMGLPPGWLTPYTWEGTDSSPPVPEQPGTRFASAPAGPTNPTRKKTLMPTNLYLGDCRWILEHHDFGGRKIDCVLTDPPYGVDFQSTYGKDPETREKYQAKIEDDETVELAIERFAETMKLTAPHLADICELYVFSEWHVAPEWQKFLETLEEPYGIRLMQLIIWDKGYPGIGDLKYNWGCGHEFIYYLKRGNRRVPYRRSAIIAVDKVRPGTNVHPTQKPTELLDILIQYSTDPGQLIFDPYAGSGSTLVAARDAGRDAIGIEIDKGYFDSAQARLNEGGLLGL